MAITEFQEGRGLDDFCIKVGRCQSTYTEWKDQYVQRCTLSNATRYTQRLEYEVLWREFSAFHPQIEDQYSRHIISFPEYTAEVDAYVARRQEELKEEAKKELEEQPKDEPKEEPKEEPKHDL
jgi:hypothetical protein